MELLINPLTNAKAYVYQVGGAYLTTCMELPMHVLTNDKAYMYQVGGAISLLWSD